MISPCATGPNGRDQAGRFAAGNRCAKGNPFARRMAELRSALISAVTDEDLRDIIKALIEKAKRGDVPAAKEVLDRTLGRPQEADLIQRLEELEAMLTTRIQAATAGAMADVDVDDGVDDVGLMRNSDAN